MIREQYTFVEPTMRNACICLGMKHVYEKKKVVMIVFLNFFRTFAHLLRGKKLKKIKKKMPFIVVSKDCIQKGNSAINRSKRTSWNAENVLVQSRTVLGSYRMTFSRNKISEEAKKAFYKVTKNE